LKRILGAGSASAFAAVLLSGFMGANSAFAQQVQARFPVVQAVISTAAEATPVEADGSPVVPASLDQLVEANMTGAPLDAEGKCLATAVYFEAMGESLHGQLAVANVVINRSRSDLYPSSWCKVVKQKAQFSFVRSGRFPRINVHGEEWRKAQAIARVAAANLMTAIPSDVMWYHADYVAPKWRLGLNKVEKIGAHIFYRA
jgi:spore germination cell wall hydrolase CwlJ-like protein